MLLVWYIYRLYLIIIIPRQKIIKLLPKKSRKWSQSPITVVVQEIEFNFTVIGWTLHFDPDFMGPSTESNYHNLKYLCLKDFHSDIGHKPSRTWFQYVMNNTWENNYHVQTYTGREKKTFSI